MQPNPNSRPNLPEPDADSARHSAEVVRHIQGMIDDAGGSIPFAQYMHEALYAPGLGYYRAGQAKLGPAGDFVTAPEVSSLFGHVLARQVAAVLQQCGGDVLEPGAGSGALAVSMLRKLAELGVLPDRYLILEVSADLKARQQASIRKEAPEHADRVAWLSKLPQAFTGVIVANEVADALPVERFLIRGSEILQARVIARGDGFAWRFDAAPALIRDKIREIEAAIGRRLEEGYQSEVSPAVTNWIGDLSAAVAEGVVLLIDYGVSRREYYAPDRSDGWLRCHFRHRVHSEPLILAGIQDLTSWVDFSAVAAAAAANHLRVAGYVTQADLLIQGGLEDELAGFADLPLDRQVELSAAVKVLTLPAEMGENFKCMSLCRGDINMPPALNRLDRAHAL